MTNQSYKGKIKNTGCQKVDAVYKNTKKSNSVKANVNKSK